MAAIIHIANIWQTSIYANSYKNRIFWKEVVVRAEQSIDEKCFDITGVDVTNDSILELSGKPVVLDVIPDIATKLYNIGILHARKDTKEVTVYKMT